MKEKQNSSSKEAFLENLRTYFFIQVGGQKVKKNLLEVLTVSVETPI